MRIVLFRESIDSFNYFTDMLAGCLTQLGHTVFVMDLLSPKGFQDLALFLAGGAPELVIAFDRIGLHSPEFISIWDKLGCLCVNLFMDPPFRFHSLLSAPPKHLLMFCPDRKHVEYIRTWFPDAGDVCFLPHPATDPGFEDDNPESFAPGPANVTEDPTTADPANKSTGSVSVSDTAQDVPSGSKGGPGEGLGRRRKNPIPWERREYELLFPGSFYSPEERLQGLCASAGDETIGKLYPEIFHYMLKEPDTDIIDASLAVLKNHALPEEPSFLTRFYSTLEPLDWAIRMEHRRRALKAIAESGISLSLLGRGFEALEISSLPNVRILSERIPFAETFAYMERSRAVLNVMPGFKDGSHDRVFNTALRGALPVSDKSLFLTECFGDPESVLFYERGKEEELPEKLNDILQDPETAQERICRAEKIVRQNFGFRKYTEQILKKCRSCVCPNDRKD